MTRIRPPALPRRRRLPRRARRPCRLGGDAARADRRRSCSALAPSVTRRGGRCRRHDGPHRGARPGARPGRRDDACASGGSRRRPPRAGSPRRCAAGDVTLDGISVSSGGIEVTIPRMDVAGTNAGKAEFAAPFDGSSTTPLSQRLAALTAASISIPEMSVRKAIGEGKFNGVYKDVRIVGLNAGVIRSAASSGGVFDGKGKDQPPMQGSFGPVAATDIDMPLIARAYLEPAGPGDTELKTAYGALLGREHHRHQRPRREVHDRAHERQELQDEADQGALAPADPGHGRQAEARGPPARGAQPGRQRPRRHAGGLQPRQHGGDGRGAARGRLRRRGPRPDRAHRLHRRAGRPGERDAAGGARRHVARTPSGASG